MYRELYLCAKGKNKPLKKKNMTHQIAYIGKDASQRNRKSEPMERPRQWRHCVTIFHLRVMDTISGILARHHSHFSELAFMMVIFFCFVNGGIRVTFIENGIYQYSTTTNLMSKMLPILRFSISNFQFNIVILAVVVRSRIIHFFAYVCTIVT